MGSTRCMLSVIKRKGGRMRTLYQCGKARVYGKWVYCASGRYLSSTSGGISINRLKAGEPLELVACQKCPDYDRLGGPVKKEDRGWI